MIHENISYGYDYDLENNILIGRENIKDYGIFSTFTLMIAALMIVFKVYNKHPIYINGKNILNKINDDKNFDMYQHLFHIDESIEIEFDGETPPVPFGPNDHHTIYSEKYSKYYNIFFKKYFNINDGIKDKINILMNKYEINTEHSIGIIYRDSDKWTDMGGFNYVSAGAYFRKCSEILENDNLKVLIQSDNLGVVDVFKQQFNAIFFSETSLDKPSNVYPPVPLTNKMMWLEYYIASLWIHSKCKYVITYTGNSGFFVYLNRGTTKNLIQEITFTKNYNDFFITNN